jgi:enoyl-CoA hydratase/carnithine racemase
VLSLSDAGDAATITLSRPEKRNSQTPAMWLWLTRAVRDLPQSVRVLILAGAGSSFSAGLDRAVLDRAVLFGDGSDDPADLGRLARMSEAAATAAIADWQEAFGLAARPDLVSIALVQGHAIGAGFQLALGCDFRIAADDVQLSMAEVSLGLVPDLGGTKRLVELVGFSHAASICLTGRRVGADEAFRIGLVNEVVPVAELATAGQRLATSVLAPPRDAVIEIKALLLAASGQPQAEQERAEREAQHRRLRALAGIESD